MRRFTTRRLADAATREEPSVAASSREEINEILFGGAAVTAPLGSVVASGVTVILVWDSMPHSSLLIWLAITSVASILTVATHVVRPFRDRYDQHGVALVARATATMIGLCFGFMLWLDIEASQDPLTQMTFVAVSMAVSSGAVVGLPGTSGIGSSTLYGIWALAIPALLVQGSYLLAISSAVYVAVMMIDIVDTQDFLMEILKLRHVSREQAEDAKRAALLDPLTGLLNRSGLEQAMISFERTEGTVTAMHVDLDHFKLVNDRFGHRAGDQVLVEAAERLRPLLEEVDVFTRLGGDEFLVVLNREMDDDEQSDFARKLIRALEAPFVIDEVDVRISASVGIAVLAASCFDLGQAQSEADHALYMAKGRGRRRSVRYDAEVRTALNERSELESALRLAIQRREIVAWGQPIVDLTTHGIAAVEFLARWERSPGEFCPPDVFIPVAEEIGLIGDLGLQILEQACETLDSWSRNPELANVAINVNVSPRQLGHLNFVPEVWAILDRWHIRRELLVLELTESAELHDLVDMDQTLDDLVGLGVSLALDDFGSGYSSVQHLLNLPIEFVKIDGALVTDLGKNDRHSAIVRSIRDLASAIGRTAVVEGVETNTQADQLALLRFRLAQGYLYGRPQPIGALEADMLAGLDTGRAVYRPLPVAERDVFVPHG